MFVPRTSAGLLATLPADEDEVPPPSSAVGPGVLEPLPWQRFMAVVRRRPQVGLRPSLREPPRDATCPA